MTLIVPTAYRRNFIRQQNEQKLAQASDAQEVELKCLRCFRRADIAARCNDCRAKRTEGNKGRKR